MHTKRERSGEAALDSVQTYSIMNGGPLPAPFAYKASWRLAVREPTILHADIDAFFASVEQVLRPELRGRPVVVGSAHPRRGVVASASYEARAFGLRAGMPIIQARRLCPDAVCLPGSYREYVRFSREVFAVLEEVSPALERVGMDEAYLDLAGCERLYGALGAGPLGRTPFARGEGGAWMRREGRAAPPAGRSLLPRECRWVAATALWIKRRWRRARG